MVRDGAVVVDVGINRVDDPARRRGIASWATSISTRWRRAASLITPVPGRRRTDDGGDAHVQHAGGVPHAGRRGMSFAEERVFAVGGDQRPRARDARGRVFRGGDRGAKCPICACRRPGHVYFKLKDAVAQIAAVCFRADARRIDFELEDGAQVIARGNLTLYDAQGSYQLVARGIEPAGRGDLERALRLLIARLREEGLFDPARKRAVAALSRPLAVVTSPPGAAIRDILSTLRAAFRASRCSSLPVQVQGDAAPAQIVRALDAVSARGDVDVVILGRGGGSIEDLRGVQRRGAWRAPSIAAPRR